MHPQSNSIKSLVLHLSPVNPPSPEVLSHPQTLPELIATATIHWLIWEQYGPSDKIHNFISWNNDNKTNNTIVLFFSSEQPHILMIILCSCAVNISQV